MWEYCVSCLCPVFCNSHWSCDIAAIIWEILWYLNTMNKGMKSCLGWDLGNGINLLLRSMTSKQSKSTLKLELN